MLVVIPQLVELSARVARSTQMLAKLVTSRPLPTLVMFSAVNALCVAKQVKMSICK